jgi:hypothetical protein
MAADHSIPIFFVGDIVMKIHGSKAQDSASDSQTILEYNKIKPWIRLRGKTPASTDSEPI